MRTDGRQPDELRPVKIETGYLVTAEGSALITVGHTRVLCAASVEDTVPGFLRGSGKGWVTAEYSMLPRSTQTRTPRESSRGKISGRTHEIQRLIGRSLRAVVDLEAMGERTVTLDCDVIQADGGTRTAAITGACVALALAFQQMVQYGMLPRSPLKEFVTATSAGIIAGVGMLDLCYEEDSRAEVDLNLVITAGGKFVEVQATGEQSVFDDAQLTQLIALSRGGLEQLLELQRRAVEGR